MKLSDTTFPALDGTVHQDQRALDEAARDFGHIVHALPRAVVAPGSVRDVVELLRHARGSRIPVAARGRGHNMCGLATARDGIVVDMRGLCGLRDSTETTVLVDAGASFRDVLRWLRPRGRTLPVLPGYLDLSIGGVISVGGIGGSSFRHGTVADNVVELEVVTGKGELVVCSPENNAALFDGCRGTLGQLGIITAARLRVTRAPERIHVTTFAHGSLEGMLVDAFRLAEGGSCELLGVTVVPDGRELRCFLEAGTFEVPREGSVVTNLSRSGDVVNETKHDYESFVSRADELEVLLRQTGAWHAPHPWFDVFLPADIAAAFTVSALRALGDLDPRQDAVLAYPLCRRAFRAPFVRVPDVDRFMLLDVLRNASTPTIEAAMNGVRVNAELHVAAAGQGGVLYPIGAVPSSAADWAHHYGASFASFVELKRHHDPDAILGPGVGMVAPRPLAAP